MHAGFPILFLHLSQELIVFHEFEEFTEELLGLCDVDDSVVHESEHGGCLVEGKQHEFQIMRVDVRDFFIWTEYALFLDLLYAVFDEV